MKRAIVNIHLDQQREFSIEIQEPGIIHEFIMGYAKKKVSVLASASQAGDMIEEIPTLVVEVDPDGAMRKRTFAIVPMGMAIEAPNIAYRGSVISKAGQGAMFHLFEEISEEVGK